MWGMAVAAGWLGVALFARWLLRGSVRGPDNVPTALVARGIQFYVRLVHRLRIDGREHLPPAGTGLPLILIANHTAGIDPLVIQAGIPYDPRWMMGADMMIPGLDWMWELARIIPVERFDLLARRLAVGPSDVPLRGQQHLHRGDGVSLAGGFLARSFQIRLDEQRVRRDAGDL